jgi:uncharacterized protein YdaU (DUF1376 family)
MHYYSFNIADYRKDTGHLTLLEHGIYRQLLDTYYLDEKPIKTQSVLRRLSIRTEEEKTAFENVVNDFFERSECGEFIIHSRVDDEIDRYHKKVETAKANGSKGGRPPKPKKTKPVNSANQEKTKSKANQEPITNNQEPITNNKKTNKKDLCPAKPDISPHAQQVFDYWVQVMGRGSQTQFTAERKKKVRERLKTYTVDQIKMAIDGCTKSDFHMGRDPKSNGLFNDLELICRTSTKLEEFIQKLNPAAKTDNDDFVSGANQNSTPWGDVYV